MDEIRFRRMLEQLHCELNGIDSVDDKGREILCSIREDIQKILNQSGEDYRDQNRSLLKGLKGALSYFEKSHPTLSLTIGQMIDTLSNMGI